MSVIVRMNAGWALAAEARAIGRSSASQVWPRFVVEVVEHLDVVTHEADWADDDRRQVPRGVLDAQVVVDVWVEPGVLRAPAAALEHQRPVVDAQAACDLGARGEQLLPVRVGAAHRGRHAVGREDQSSGGLDLDRQAVAGAAPRGRRPPSGSRRADASRRRRSHPPADGRRQTPPGAPAGRSACTACSSNRTGGRRRPRRWPDRCRRRPSAPARRAAAASSCASPRTLADPGRGRPGAGAVLRPAPSCTG